MSCGRQGRFLLATFQEVLDGIEPETGSLCEAYNDAVYFKWVAHAPSLGTPASGQHQFSARCLFLQPCLYSARKCSTLHFTSKKQTSLARTHACTRDILQVHACCCRDEALRAFKLGILSLGERAEVDTLFEATCARIHDTAAGARLQLPDALRPCGLPLSAMYHVNFSGESNQPTASPVALRRSTKSCAS